MTTREKQLTVAVAAAGALWAGSQGWVRYRNAVDAAHEAQATAEQELAAAEVEVNRGRRARAQVVAWREQSLPTDVDVAESLYRDWLSGELKAAGLSVPQVSERARARVGEEAAELTFTVSAKGELKQWLDFFKRFRAAPHLHRLSEATLVPDDERKQLTGTLRVDALSLPDGRRQDKLAQADESADADHEATGELIAAIDQRGPFRPYEGKKKEKAESGADKAVVSGFYGGGIGWVVTIRQGDSNDIKRYTVGDKVKFGTFEATLVELDGRRVVYETPEGKFEVRLGQNFGQGQRIDEDA